jgi:hypothetical protein
MVTKTHADVPKNLYPEDRLSASHDTRSYLALRFHNIGFSFPMENGIVAVFHFYFPYS